MTVIRHVEVVPDDEHDDDDDDDKEMDEEAKEPQSSLSKCWSVATAHVPIYSGGKVTHCNTRGLEDDAGKEVPFMILPVGGDLAIVDARKGVRMRTIRISDDGLDGESIVCYALSWNDRMLVTFSRNQLLRQYDLSSPLWPHDQPAPVQQYLWGKSGHTLPVTHMEFHRSNVFLATGSVDGTVRVWDTRYRYVTHVFRHTTSNDNNSGGTHAITALRWKGDEENATLLFIAAGRADGSITIYDLAREAAAARSGTTVLRDHVGAVTCVDWSHNNNVFVSAGRDSVLNIWKMETTDAKKKKRKKDVPTSPVTTYKRIHTKPVYEQVEGMILLPSTDLLVATAGSKGVVRLWKSTLQDQGTQSGFSCIAEQPSLEAFGETKGGYLELTHNKQDNDDDNDANQLVVTDAEHNVSFLSLPTLSTKRTIIGHNDEILDLKLIPTQTAAPSGRIVVATNSPQALLFELDTFSCDILKGHTATILCVDVSPCGRFVATCGKDKTMRLWHCASRRCVAIATGHTEAVGAAALSRKIGKYEVVGKGAVNGGGAFAVTASKDRTLKRWNLPGALDKIADAMALEAAASVRAHEKDINIVSVAPNDSLVATGSQDKTAKLWKSTNLALLGTLRGHKRGVWDCQFSPVDRVLATASGDRTIKLWSLTNFGCVRTFQGHIASALRVRFLTAGLQLVSSGADGLVKVWTIRTNECETTMDGHTDKVWSLDVAPDGKHVVTGGADSRIVLWKDTTTEEEKRQRVQEEHNIVMEQRLANHLRSMEYEQALEIALDLEKPRQALKVFQSMLEHDVEKKTDTLKQHVGTWSSETTVQVLRYCRDWNTKAIHSHTAMKVVNAIVRTVPPRDLAATKGVPEILAGIIPYAERHFDRLDRLCTNSYMLDYTLFSMGKMDIGDQTMQEDLASWESKSKLPPRRMDGRVQVGGNAVVGSNNEEEVITVGESDSDDDDDDDDDDDESNSSNESS